MRQLDTPLETSGRTRFLYWFLVLALILGVLQIYILPFLPLAIWWILVMAPFVLVGRGVKAPLFSLVITAVVMIQLFAAAWSPDALQALRSAATVFCLLVVLVATAKLLSVRPTLVRRILSLSGLFVFIHASLIGIFFFLPHIESQYLTSSFAPYFSGKGVTRIFTDLFNNVVLEGKAGGFFVNGNTASMFMGVCSMLFVASAVKFGSKWQGVVAAVSYTGALMTGSKTALLIGVGWVGACLLLYAAARKAHLLVPGLLFAAIGVQAGLVVILEKSPEFAMDSAHTFGSRQLMWNVAFDGLSESSILGLGFGGWFNQYEKYGSAIGFSVRPAHNLILQTWLDSGVVAVFVLFVFYGAILLACLKLLRSGEKSNSAIACSLLAMTGWIFIHGQGDNTAFYGDTHSLAYFAVGLAILSHSLTESDTKIGTRPGQQAFLKAKGKLQYPGVVLNAPGRASRGGRRIP